MHTRTTSWLRHRLGRAVVLSYALALLVPGPGLWLRRPHPLPPAHLTLHTAPLLLSLVLFSAGLQVPVRALGALARRPQVLLAGLVLHLAIPLAVVPFVALLLRCTPDTDGGSGLLTAMILVVAMPVAAGATVWTDRGGGDQPTMVGLVLASTLLSPLTTPVLLAAFSPWSAAVTPPPSPTPAGWPGAASPSPRWSFPARRACWAHSSCPRGSGAVWSRRWHRRPWPDRWS